MGGPDDFGTFGFSDTFGLKVLVVVFLSVTALDAEADVGLETGDVPGDLDLLLIIPKDRLILLNTPFFFTLDDVVEPWSLMILLLGAGMIWLWIVLTQLLGEKATSVVMVVGV